MSIIKKRILIPVMVACLLFVSTVKPVQVKAEPITITTTSVLVIASLLAMGITVITNPELTDNLAEAISNLSTVIYTGASDFLDSAVVTAINGALTLGEMSSDLLKSFTDGVKSFFSSKGLSDISNSVIDLTSLTAMGATINELITKSTVSNTLNIPSNTNKNYPFGIYNLNQQFSTSISVLTGSSYKYYLGIPSTKYARDNWGTSRANNMPRVFEPFTNALFESIVVGSMTASSIGFTGKPFQDYSTAFKRHEVGSFKGNELVFGYFFKAIGLELVDSIDHLTMQDGIPYKYISLDDNTYFMPFTYGMLSQYYPNDINIGNLYLNEAVVNSAIGSSSAVIGQVGSKPIDQTDTNEKINTMYPGGTLALPQNPTLPDIMDDSVGTITRPGDIGITDIEDVTLPFPVFPDIDWSLPTLGEIVTGGLLGSLFGWLGNTFGKLVTWVGDVVSWGFMSVLELLRELLKGILSIPGLLKEILAWLGSLVGALYTTIVDALTWAFGIDITLIQPHLNNFFTGVYMKIPLFFDLIALLTNAFSSLDYSMPVFNVVFPSMWGGGTYNAFDLTFFLPYKSMYDNVVTVFAFLYFAFKMVKTLSNFSKGGSND